MMKYYHQPRSEILEMRLWEFKSYLDCIELIENPEKRKELEQQKKTMTDKVMELKKMFWK